MGCRESAALALAPALTACLLRTGRGDKTHVIFTQARCLSRPQGAPGTSLQAPVLVGGSSIGFYFLFYFLHI